jgi:hypothetical protein
VTYFFSCDDPQETLLRLRATDPSSDMYQFAQRALGRMAGVDLALVQKWYAITRLAASASLSDVLEAEKKANL